MNKLLAALLAGAFATVAAAQTATSAPTATERQANVRATTQAGSGSSVSAARTAAQQAANVRASREVERMTKDEKEAFFEELLKSRINPNNPTGTAGTATMQKETVMESKGAPKANADIRTKEGQRVLATQLENKSDK